MKRKHSKYRKIWLLWVALEGLVATFAIMNSFLLLRYLYFSNGTAIPDCQYCRICALRRVPAAFDHADPDDRVSGA